MDNKPVTEEDIYREAIVGFVIIKDDTGKGNYSFIFTEPICVWHDGLENNISIDKTQTIVGVLPAPDGSYRVYGFGNAGHEIELGHEYVGAYHPDWVEELKSRLFEV